MLAHAEVLTLVLLRALQADRRRHGTSPVGEATANCSVPEDVAGMPVDRAALGLIPEQRHARRAVARPIRVGQPAGDEQVLLFAHIVAEQVAADVAADEVVQVGRSRHDPARRPRPPSSGDVALIHRLALLVQPVAVHVRLRELGPRRKRRVVQTERFEHLLGEHVLVALTRRRLDHQSDGDVVGVGVAVLRCSGGSSVALRRRTPTCQPAAPPPPEAALLEERLGFREVGKPARVVQQLTEGDSPQAAGRSGSRSAIVSSSESTPSSTSEAPSPR